MQTNNPIKDLNEFVEKVDDMKKKDRMDLSSDQDLSMAIMNLIAIEEHFFFTGAKTGKNEYYDLINVVREMRKELLKEIIKEYEGEVWCISKHLLSASMRLMEVGTKQLSMGKKDVAYSLFGKAFDLYSLFWGLNMKLIKLDDVKKADSGIAQAAEKEAFGQKDAIRHGQGQPAVGTGAEKKGLMAKLNEMVRKVVDCCIE
ncbi:MAG: hypothetical protein WC397_04125 [Candidatus Paceibacterota bacterium]|jgi:hypothetical protein